MDQNGGLDRWGAANVGNGTAALPTANNPYANVNCSTRGRQNIVTGARHVLKLVDGGLGNLPVRPITARAALQWRRRTQFTFREITIPTSLIRSG